MHLGEFIQALHTAALITYYTWAYGFRCKRVTGTEEIRQHAGEVKVRQLGVCVCVCEAGRGAG